VEKEESIAFCAPVLFIQLFDPLPGQLQQRLVFRSRLLVRVPEISQQAEVQVLVPVCEEPDFQRLDQVLDVSALMSMVGITTRVRDSGGIPLEKSIRGSGCGVASTVVSQLTSATASWLAPASRICQ